MRSRYLRVVFFILTLLIMEAAAVAATSLKITYNSRNGYLLAGDIVEFTIVPDVKTDPTVGFQVFLTFDPEIFKPVFTDGRPFKQGTFITNNPYNLNNTHNDVWGLPDQNGIPDFQLDYGQNTPVAVGGTRPYVTGSGKLASFKLQVLTIPDNPEQKTTIKFDHTTRESRQTGYFFYDLEYLTSNFRKFDYAYDCDVFITGVGIVPELVDTTITPGGSISKFLGEHYIGFVFDSTQAIWTDSVLVKPNNTNFAIDTVNNADMMTFTTAANSHGKLEALVKLDVPDGSYHDETLWEVIVDHPPVVTGTAFTFREDVDSTLSTALLFTDPDDSGGNISLGLEANDSVYLVYNNDNTFTLSSQENWFGTRNLSVTVTDSLGISDEGVVTFTVLPVNDLPIVNFNGVESVHLKDTLVIHHGVEDTLSLDDFLTDVEDSTGTWTWVNSDAVNLQVANAGNNRVAFSVTQTGFYGDVPVSFTVTDSDGGQGTDTLIVSVRSFPPVSLMKDIMVLTLDTTKTAEFPLADKVSDPDTPRGDFTWTFEVLDPKTGLEDPHITTAVSGDTLSIKTDTTYFKENLLALTITDDDNNTVYDTVNVVFIVSYAPYILPLETWYLVEDSVYSLIDLDTVVMDYRDPPSAISWKVDSVKTDLMTVAVDAQTHVMTVTTNTNRRYGRNILQLTATNAHNNSTKTEMTVYVISRDPNPNILELPSDTLFWQDSVFYADLKTMVIDDMTRVDSIKWEVNSHRGLIRAHITEGDSLFLITGVGTSGSQPDSLFFRADDEDGNYSTKTIPMWVIEDSAPKWSPIPYQRMTTLDTVRTLYLGGLVNDDMTEDSLLGLAFIPLLNFDKFRYARISPEQDSLRLSIDPAHRGMIYFRMSAVDEFGHASTSDTFKVEMLPGYPPVWIPISGITFSNDKVDTSLVLGNYLTDMDTPIENIDFTHTTLVDESILSISIRSDSRVLINPVDKTLPLKTWVKFTADDGDSSVSTVVNVTVNDVTPPAANVQHVYNSVMPYRVLLLVAADKSVSQFTANIFKDGVQSTITFDLFDPDLKVYSANYQTRGPGTYELKVTLSDVRNNSGTIIDEWVVTSIVGKQAARIYSPDGIISFDASGNEDGEEIVVYSTQSREESAAELGKTAVIDSRRIYSLDSPNAPESYFVVRRSAEGLDRRSGFFTIDAAGNSEYVSTYYDRSKREFQAVLPWNQSFIFGDSDREAEERSLDTEALSCYPNPFNSTLTVEWTSLLPGPASISVYNILGQRVYHSGTRHFDAGLNRFSWEAVDQFSKPLPSSIYFVRYENGSERVLLKKITLLR